MDGFKGILLDGQIANGKEGGKGGKGEVRCTHEVRLFPHRI